MKKLKFRFTKSDLIIFICYWVLVIVVKIAFNKDVYNLSTEKLIASTLFTFVLDNITVFIIIFTLTGILFWDKPALRALYFGIILVFSVFYMMFYEWLIYDRFQISMQKIFGGIMNHGRSYFPLLLVFSTRIIRRYHKDSLRAQMEKDEEEKKRLRARISPHFVVNTLYLFARKERKYNNDELVGMITPLMQYVLYDSQEDWITLDDEVAFLKEYIEVERNQLVFPEILDVKLGGDTQNLKIAPGILVQYVENVFKHGGKTAADLMCIELYIQAGSLYLLTSNTFVPKLAERQGIGIGLDNSKRTLDLNYPDRYTLSIDDHAPHYGVELSIKLDKL